MKKKLRILIVNDWGYKFGGSQIYTFELAKLLKKLGNHVRVITSDLNPEKRLLSDYQFKHFNNKKFISKFLGYLYNPNSKRCLSKIIREFSPDIVHLNYIFVQNSPSIFLCLKKIPTVMTLHSSDLICPLAGVDSNREICFSNFGRIKCINCLRLAYPYQRSKFYLYKYLSKNIDKFIAVSRYVKNYFIKNNYCNKNKIKVIHNSVNLLKYSKIRNFKSILYVGRLPREKGVEYLVKSMTKIVKENKKIRLYIAGSGDEEKNLKQLTKELNLQRNIIFLGEIPYNKIEKYYKMSGIIIVPSICPDSLPTVIIEAMSVGRPVIGTRVGGIPEMIEDGKTGYLVEPGNHNQIAEKVIYLLKRPKLMQKMGLAGRKKAEKEFDIKDYAKKIEKVYQEVIKKNKKKIYNNGGSEIFK